MSNITLRLVKGSPLTNQEVDDNFANLNTDKYEAGDSASFQDVTLDNMSGPISWNVDDGTLDVPLNASVTLQMGQEFVFYAKATGAISNGDVVMFAGAQGGHLLISKCNMGAVGFDPTHVVGIATQDFANNEFGYVTSIGKVRGINTSSLTEGDVLYVDPAVSGGYTSTKPSSPNHIIQIAAVVRSHGTQGTLLVRTTHMPDTDEVPEGSTNLYFTDARATAAIKADSSWNASNWDTAYGWGDHSGLYLPINAVTLPDQTGHSGQFLTTNGTVADWATVDTSNGDTAYSWGDHSTEGYLTSETNDYLDSATFSGGTLTLGRTGSLSDVTVNLDGRYSQTDTNTTYSVSAADVASGKAIRLTGSNSVTDDVILAGGSNVSLTRSGDTITINSADAPADVVTTLSKVGNDLRYVNEAGTTATIDLTSYLDDTNLSKILSGTMSSSGIATFSRDDNSTFTVDMSVLLDDTNLARIVSAAWNTGNGVLTLTRNDGSTIPVDLDNRYLQSYTETDTLQSVTTRGNSTSRNITISKSNTGAGYSSYADMMIEDVDAHLDITSTNGGTWGSAINLREGNTSSFVNSWSIARTTGASPDLRFNFGTGNDHNIAGTKVRFTSSGQVHASSFHGSIDYSNITNPPVIDNSVDYINGASFNTSNGVLTLSGVGRAGATVDLDGRYYSTSDSDSRYVNVTGDTMTGVLTFNRSATRQVINLNGTAGAHSLGWEAYHNTYGPHTWNSGFIGHKFYSNANTLTATIGTGGASGSTVSTFYGRTDFPAGLTSQTLDIGYTGDRTIQALSTDKSFGTYGDLHLQHYGGDLHAVHGGGVIYDNGSRVFSDRYHPNADKWTTARSHTVTLTGDVTGSASQSVDGTGNRTWTISTAVGNNSHSHSNYMLRSSSTQTGINSQLESSGYRFDPSTNNPTNEHYAVLTYGNQTNVVGQVATHFVTGQAYTRGHNSSWSSWRKQWDSLNDGSGSGLDADLLDGVHGSSFLRSDADDTASGQYSFTKVNDHAIKVGTIRGTAVGGQSGDFIQLYERVNIGGPSGWGHASTTAAPTYGLSTYGGASLATHTGSVTISGNTAWHAGNDGSGSGLDADLLDGNHASAFALAHSHPYLSSASDSEQVGEFGLIYWNKGTAKVNSDPRTNEPNYDADLTNIHWWSTTAAGANYGRVGHALYNGSAYQYLHTRSGQAHLYHNNNKMWTSGNDGSGSGLDADLLDGVHASSFNRKDTNTQYLRPYYAYTNYLTTQSANTLSNQMGGDGGIRVDFINGQSFGTWGHCLTWSGYHAYNMYQLAGYYHVNGASDLWFRSEKDHTNDEWTAWNKIYHTGNDGSGSGLDADLLDGQQGSYYASASSIGNGTLTITTSGSASGGGTFSANQSGNTTINITATDTNTTYNFSGSSFTSRNSGNINTIDNSTSNMVGYVNGSSAAGYSDGGAWVAAYSSSWVGQLFLNFRDGALATRGKNNGTWQGWRKVWDNTNDGSGSGLDADLLDGLNSTDFARADYINSNYKDFTVNGDANTYYPVSISEGGHYGFHTYSISRGYSWTAPSTWNTASHKGGLTFTFQNSGDSAWGGNDKTIRVIQFAETYSTMVGGLALSTGGAAGGGVIVWLRGGGAQYRFHSPNGSKATATVHLTSVTASNGTVYAPRSYNSGTVNGEVNSRYPVRGTGGLYSNNHVVWHAGNDGSGTGLDADLLDGQHASAFASASHSHSNYLTTTGKAADADTVDGIQASRIVYGDGSYKSRSTSTFHNNVSGFHFYSGATNAPTAEWYNWITCRGNSWGNSDEYSFQLAHNFWNNSGFYVRRTQSGTEYGWDKIWTSGNDGSGTGLDADLLDGIQGSGYVRTSAESDLNMNSYDITSANAVNAESLSLLSADIKSLGGGQLVVAYENNTKNFAKSTLLGFGTVSAIGTTLALSAGSDKVTVGAGNATGKKIIVDPTAGVLELKLDPNTSPGHTYMRFMHSGDSTIRGSIYRNYGSIVYATSSDYRLKENVVPLTGAIEKLKTIPVYNFNFTENPEVTVDGFIAHELQEVMPEAVTGTKDGMRTEEYEITPAEVVVHEVQAPKYDSEGNLLQEAVTREEIVTPAIMGTKEVPEYQGVDQSKLTPLLTAALQEALTKIEQLELRINALEN